MKKRILLIIVVFALLLSGCTLSPADKALVKEAGMTKSVLLNKYSLSKDVILSIKNVPLSLPLPDFLTIIYKNNSDSQSYFYGEGCFLEKKLNNTWYMFPAPTVYLIAHLLKPQASGEVDCYISQYQEYMTVGQYRIVCTVKSDIDSNINEIVICEFSIE